MAGDLVETVRRWGRRRWDRIVGNKKSAEDKPSSSGSSEGEEGEEDDIQYLKRCAEIPSLRPVQVHSNRYKGGPAAADRHRNVRLFWGRLVFPGFLALHCKSKAGNELVRVLDCLWRWRIVVGCSLPGLPSICFFKPKLARLRI